MADSKFAPRPGLMHPNAAAMFLARVDRSGARVALRHQIDGVWRGWTWAEFAQAAREIAMGLIEGLGVQRGERVALLAHTRIEWVLCDVAIAMAGAVSVPLYPSLTPEQLAFIVEDAGCAVALVGDPEQLGRLLDPDQKSKLGSLRHAVWLDDRTEPHGKRRGEPISLDEVQPRLAPVLETCSLRSFHGLRTEGARALDRDGSALQARIDGTSLEDDFTWVYTSGTTGRPKGVVLSHRNIVYESWAIKNAVPVDHTDEQLMVLPLAHIFARHLVWGAMEQGAVTAFAQSMDTVAQDLKEVAPTYMGGVPRIYEKVYERIQSRVAEGGTAKRTVFDWALAVGRRVSVCRQRGQVPPTGLALKMAAADRLVFADIRAVFGGRLRFFVSGGAPLGKELAEFFHAAGVLILEGYGLTETTGATNVNRPDRFRFGTVGPALPGCEIRIADDGEVLIRGDNVMARYHGLPEDSRAALDAAGWFHTGDIGEMSDGFLRITDRKKDLFKTAGGKYIAPQPLENRLAGRDGVAHAVVDGAGRPYAVVLVALDEDAGLRLSEAEGLGCSSYADLARHPRIRQLVQGYVDELNADLPPYETLKAFAVAPAPFAEATGELTPTLKVRRRVVLERYRDELDRLYERGR